MIVQRIAGGVLPSHLIDVARSELRRLLTTPELVVGDRRRRRLTTRLEKLKQQHEWGDIDDDEYRAKRDETREALDLLPDGDRVKVFDAYRAQVLGLADAIGFAAPGRQEELCHIVLERVVVDDREIEAVEWAAPVRTFFERQREYPQGDSNP